MDIAAWRRKIDKLDRKLVELISRRAAAAQEIGRLKRHTAMPIYEPDREKRIFDNVRAANPGPIPDDELVRIFQRLIETMRSLQKHEMLDAVDESRSKRGASKQRSRKSK